MFTLCDKDLDELEFALNSIRRGGPPQSFFDGLCKRGQVIAKNVLVSVYAIVDELRERRENERRQWEEQRDRWGAQKSV
jgi:hypothetical protein